MAIAGVTTDYTDRKIDLHILQGVDPNKVKVVTPSFGVQSNFCAGIQKLVQRFSIALLTDKGSQKQYPAFGTDLLKTLRNRNMLYNKADIYPIFNYACYKVVKDFRDFQAKNPDFPNDEKLNTAYLSDIILSNDSVSFKVTIVPVSGDTTTFLIPLPKPNE